MSNIHDVILRNHEEIHEGSFFTATHLFTDVADNAFADLRITTGATNELHIGWSIVAEGKAYMVMQQGTTFTDAGTGVTAFNNKTASVTATDATFRHTPTINMDGPLKIDSILINGGTGPKTTGGDAKQGVEWIFETSEEFLLRVQNVAGAAKDISIQLEWYEEVE